MSSVFDRLNRELEGFSRRAQTAIDEGKIQIELMRVKRRRDNAARDLGRLTHRRERGEAIEARRIDALMLRLDDLEAEITRLERKLAASRGEKAASVEDGPVM